MEYAIDQLFICAVGLEVDAGLRAVLSVWRRVQFFNQQVMGCDDTDALALVVVADHILNVNVLTVRRTIFACATPKSIPPPPLLASRRP